jgi:RNase P subunit RPR2
MRYEHSNKDTLRRPLCPSCAQLMRLVRVTSRFEKLPDLYVFECRACDLTHIEAA